MKIKKARVLLIILVLIVAAAVIILLKLRSGDVTPAIIVRTIAGAPLETNGPRFEDPFGIALDKNGDVYVTDGEKGRLWLIKVGGNARVVIDGLDTPSGLAIASDGSLVIAETGANVISRVYPTDGRKEIVAGITGRAGYSDGSSALFNGPIGVVVDTANTIYVADTYNDRVRAIESNGSVRTIAGGGEAGFADAENGSDARFNTPCGIALTPDGALIVADTGNHSIRRIEKNGRVRTIAGTGYSSGEDGFLFAAGFNEPLGVAVDKDGTIYVADSNGSAVRACGWNMFPRVWTLAGGSGAGFQDGEVENVRMNHPSGVAIAPDGTLLFADNGNKVVRSIGPSSSKWGTVLDSNTIAKLWPSVSEMRSAAPPRWPYDPPERPREIAATFGEIRGELTESDKEAWFHNGLDIPGSYGETVRAVRTERILNPLSVKDVGTQRERIRFPMLGYIHLRIGRDENDKSLDEEKFLVQRDLRGKIKYVRVRRGTKFSAGEAIGTLNNQNHVHLTAGPIGKEINAIAVLELPGIKDTVAPTIEMDGVRFYDSSWQECKGNDKSTPINLSGDVRIVVRAYDQMDGNAARRRLGVYRIGYQVLGPNAATPVPGFEEPRVTIEFENLPRDENAAQLAYASGSRSGATGETVFAYIVTNIVRGTETRDAFFSTKSLPDGDYTIRIFVEDFFGNRMTRDTKVRLRNSGG